MTINCLIGKNNIENLLFKNKEGALTYWSGEIICLSFLEFLTYLQI